MCLSKVLTPGINPINKNAAKDSPVMMCVFLKDKGSRNTVSSNNGAPKQA
jgi:hypothetical protein